MSNVSAVRVLYVCAGTHNHLRSHHVTLTSLLDWLLGGCLPCMLYLAGDPHTAPE